MEKLFFKITDLNFLFASLPDWKLNFQASLITKALQQFLFVEQLSKPFLKQEIMEYFELSNL